MNVIQIMEDVSTSVITQMEAIVVHVTLVSIQVSIIALVI